MFNISTNYKNSFCELLPSMYTVAMATTLFLGIYAIRWLTSKPSYKSANDLELKSGIINNGQGEYVVFSNNNQPVEKSTFEKAHHIFAQYYPEQIAERSTDSAESEYAGRYEEIKKAVKKIDPSLEVAFIPRTLYELTYINKCIQEDLEHKSTCCVIDPSVRHAVFRDNEEGFNEFIKKTRVERECWHALPFENVNPENKNCGGDPSIVYRDDIVNIAYRLNNDIVKRFSPKPGGLTYEELASYANEEIQFLNNYYEKTDKGDVQKCSYDFLKKINSTDTKNYIAGEAVGPTALFASKKLFSHAHHMGICNDHHIQIVKNALKADCSKVAQTSIMLYRGAQISKDNVFLSVNQVYSLSFGTGLFAGCFWDPGASAFRYMHESNTAYAIPVPLNELKSSPFYVPPSNTIAQLIGQGESFHIRTLAWKGFDLKNIYMGNISAIGGHVREHLRSEIPEQDLKRKFENYKAKAILL